MLMKPGSQPGAQSPGSRFLRSVHLETDLLDAGSLQGYLPPDFPYTVVKLNLANKSFSFVEVAEFDTAPEPTIGTVIAVKTDGSCRRMAPPCDPFIYHHKWLFVADDYDGFDVEESKIRSRAWMALGDIDRTRIGKRSYWQSNVVPRLHSE